MTLHLAIECGHIDAVAGGDGFRAFAGRMQSSEGAAADSDVHGGLKRAIRRGHRVSGLGDHGGVDTPRGGAIDRTGGRDAQNKGGRFRLVARIHGIGRREKRLSLSRRHLWNDRLTRKPAHIQPITHRHGFRGRALVDQSLKLRTGDARVDRILKSTEGR